MLENLAPSIASRLLARPGPPIFASPRNSALLFLVLENHVLIRVFIWQCAVTATDVILLANGPRLALERSSNYPPSRLVRNCLLREVQ